MLDEEIDDIIRKAADQHYPNYDDQAWGKMGSLLDKHLPQKKDNRKYLLILLLFLLTAAGLYFILLYPKENKVAQTQSNNSATTAIGTQKISTASTTLNNIDNVVHKIELNSITKTSFENNTVKNTLTKGVVSAIGATQTNDNSLIGKAGKQKRNTASRYKTKVSSVDADGIADVQNNTADEDETVSTNTEPTKPIEQPQYLIANDIVKPAADSVTKQIVITDTSAKKQPLASDTKKKEEKPNKFKNNFAVTASAGPGLSYIGTNTGKTTLTYGAGIRYAFSKRLAVRTGFYVSKKIYSAAPSDYHPPKQFWTYYPNLTKINADCQVYEIPLNISYSFSQVKKHEWFGAVGLSSYLMKNETYQYNSQDPQGQQYNSTAVVENKNKNLFSVLSISGGYQYNFNDKFSLLAEPYLELPLNGVGFGNIKLNSGGLLFTAVFKPF